MGATEVLPGTDWGPRRPVSRPVPQSGPNSPSLACLAFAAAIGAATLAGLATVAERQNLPAPTVKDVVSALTSSECGEDCL